MKKSLMIIFGLTLLVTACKSSNSVVYDDAYYSPYDTYSRSMNGTLVTSSDGNVGSTALRDNESYDYSEYYPADSTESKTDTVYVIEEKTPKVTVEFGVGFGWPYYGWGPYYWGPYYMPSWYFSWGYDPWYGTYWYGSYWRPWGPMHPWYPCCCCHPVYYATTYYSTWDRPHSYQYRNANNGGIASGRSRNASSGLQVANNARRISSTGETLRQTDVRPGVTGTAARPSAAASSRPSATRPAAVRTNQSATGSRPTQSARPSTGLRPTQATRPSASERISARPSQTAGHVTQGTSTNSRQTRTGSEYVRPQNSTISRTSTSRANSSGNSVPMTTATRNSSSTRSFGNISSGSTRSGSSSGSYGGGFSGGARSGGSFGGGSVGGGRSGGGGRR